MIYDTLYKKYYNNNGNPIIDNVNTSSHWQEFAKSISVKQRAIGSDYKLKGYGFGENQSTGIIEKLFTFLFEKISFFVLKNKKPQSEIKVLKNIIKKMNLSYSQDAIRQAYTLNLLKDKLIDNNGKNILIIGDGYGVLASLIHYTYPDSKIFLIDLGPMLFFQSYYINKAFPNSNLQIVEKGFNVPSSFNFCSPDSINYLSEEKYFLTINIASMQEMSLGMVKTYFNFMRKTNTSYFYCCNRIEKIMPGGEVSSYFNYPWDKNDLHLIDQICPWHQFYIGAGANKFKIKGIPIPFVSKYDGPHWHRLTKLNSN